ncbi:hypothetical protein T09_5520 [Trichinella sp. T9]|nr:hypothetical protein T09_5520 [Trichinella sp. T9]
MYGGSSMTRTLDKHYRILTDTRRSVVAGSDITSAGFWTSGNQFLCHIYHSINSYFTYYVSLLTRNALPAHLHKCTLNLIENRWKQRITNYKWGPVMEQHPTTLGDDVNDYERRGEPVDAFAIRVQDTGEKDETMDEARRITLRTVLIEEASYSMDFRNTDPYNRRMEELTAALGRCDDSATKPSLTEDIYQRKHQATIEARLEKLEENCMRPVGNQSTRERPQPLRLLEGSSRNADDPLGLATDVVIDDTPIIQGKIRGFSIQFFFHSEAAISTISKELKTPATIRGRRISRVFGNSGHELHHVGEKSLNMVKPTKLIIWVEIPRRHEPHGEMRYGDTIHIAVNVTTTIAGLLRQYVETTSLSDGDLGRSSVIKHRLRKFVESVKLIKKALSLIEAADLRWSSPVVLGKIRMVSRGSASTTGNLTKLLIRHIEATKTSWHRTERQKIGTRNATGTMFIASDRRVQQCRGQKKVVPNMTMVRFLRALRRFISRSGRLKLLQSDNIQTFHSASRLWKLLFNNRNWKVVQDQLAKEGL